MSESSDESEVIIIAVMGVTGSGKSSFIRLVLGEETSIKPEVSDKLDSCTQVTKTYEYVINSKRVVFFDTPGFDDTYRSDADILANIAQALSASYKQNVKLSGVLYMHRIKDEKMTNTIMRNLTMFRNLCGDNAFKNVILVTTFWDELVSQAKGEMREKMLLERADWWGYMTTKGSRTRRFENTRDCALSIVADVAGLPTTALQIQEEIVDQGREISGTSAGEALNRELAILREEHQRQLEDLQRENEQAKKDHDEQLQNILEQMAKEKAEFITILEAEQAALGADRREEQRRLEQSFNDQIFRDKRERNQRDSKIAELEARLDAEKAEFDLRFNTAMAEANRIARELTAQLANAQKEDQKRYQEAIRKVRAQQRDAKRESQKWKEEVGVLNEKLGDAIKAKQVAPPKEKAKLEAKIQDIEKQKKSRLARVWEIVGPLLGIATAIVTAVAL